MTKTRRLCGILVVALLYAFGAAGAANQTATASVNVGFCSAARWISGDTLSSEKPAPVLFREFALDVKPTNAVFTVATAGWCEVYVNGEKVGRDVLSPVTCQPDKRLSSVAHDVTPFLKKGENVVEVLLGNGWFNCFTKDVWGFSSAPWLGAPKVCGELVADGKRLLGTDETWMAYDSPIVFNALRNGEYYDARREGSRANVRAVKVEAAPAMAVSPEDAVPCRAFDPIPPVRSFPAGNGGTIYDFGSNRAGWCEIEVAGEAGAKVTIDYDECLTPTNTLLGNIGIFIRRNNDPRPAQHDEYTLAGKEGGERWHPRFTYHGFRYAQVRTEGKVELKSIKSVFVHSDFNSVGSFKISDPVFEKLQDATRRSYLSNFTGIPTDCPHREKNGWTGDAQLAMETGLWNFDAKAGYIHFLRMMLDAQKPDGKVPCILPCTEKFGYGWGSGPAWDAVLFEIPWQIFRFYGDDAPAKEAYAAMKKYLSFIEFKARDDGLVEQGLGDWCAPKGAKVAPVLLTDSAYVYEFNRRVAFWAERFGETDVAAKCRARADKIKTAFNKEFYKGNGVYAGGELTSLAAPLYFRGLCADGDEKTVAAELVRRIRENGHKAMFGILGAKWIPRVLADYGHIDDAWRIFTQPDSPGWAAWVSAGEDTLWESFDANPWAASHNHIMFGDLSAWAFEYLAGIKIDEPGFAKWHAEPHLPEGVEAFEVSHTLPDGNTIRVSAWRQDEKPEFFIEIADSKQLRGEPLFDKLGAMIDISRGRVLKIPYLKQRFERMAKMGYNAVMLYTEDTYRLDGVPKWGYMRGGYSLEDIRELKAAADANGLEMVPCIQTLGHLEKYLRWEDGSDMRCTRSTLLAGEEKTYALIDKMVEFWEKGVGGKRIHVGMDEAVGFWCGEYEKRNGVRPKFEIFLEHLERVCEICRKHGFEEIMVWSDMFYRMGSKTHDYYDVSAMVPAEVAAKIPACVRLVYWDYYHDDSRFYAKMIDGHRALGSEPVLAGGIQVWSHFLHDREKTLATSSALVVAAREKGCREIWFTLWGDGGGCSSPDLAEEGLFACAEIVAGRSPEPTEENCARFRSMTGLDYRSLAKLGDVCRHYADEWPDMILDFSILYDDPLYCANLRNYLVRKPSETTDRRFYCANYRDAAWRDDGAAVVADHLQVLRECRKLEGIPAAARALVDVLEAKLTCESSTLASWKAGDRIGIEKVAKELLPRTIEAMKTFCEVYRAEWYATSRPFGFELIQRRNAGALVRLEEAQHRLDGWLSGECATIEELDEAIEPFGVYNPSPPIAW